LCPLDGFISRQRNHAAQWTALIEIKDGMREHRCEAIHRGATVLISINAPHQPPHYQK